MKEHSLRIGAFWYPVTVFGDGNKLGVWFQGCNKHCKECISPEFQPFNAGKELLPSTILNKFIDEIPDGLVISGGEPFEQPEALLDLVEEFTKKFGNDIIIYTGYTIDELENKSEPVFRKIINLTAVLIDGEYDPLKNTGIGLAGSANQNIIIRKNHDRYLNADKWKRNIMCVLNTNGRLWLIGVPPLEID